MNKTRVRAVRNRIAKLPTESCAMDSWSHGEMVGKGKPACGTTACIAGHALAQKHGLFNASTYEGNPANEAQEYLGLHDVDLFLDYCWPVKYQYMQTETGDAVAMVAVLDDLLSGKLVETDEGLEEA